MTRYCVLSRQTIGEEFPKNWTGRGRDAKGASREVVAQVVGAKMVGAGLLPTTSYADRVPNQDTQSGSMSDKKYGDHHAVTLTRSCRDDCSRAPRSRRSPCSESPGDPPHGSRSQYGRLGRKAMNGSGGTGSRGYCRQESRGRTAAPLQRQKSHLHTLWAQRVEEACRHPLDRKPTE